MWVGRGWRGAGWLLVVAVWGWGSASERSCFQSCLLDDTIFSFDPEKEKSCLMWGSALARSGWLRAPHRCLGPGAPSASSRQQPLPAPESPDMEQGEEAKPGWFGQTVPAGRGGKALRRDKNR